VIRSENSSEIIEGLPTQSLADCHFIGEVISHGHSAAISDCRKLMGVIVTDQHFLMIQTLPERLHHEQVFRIIFKKIILDIGRKARSV
jgi:hypothetical protein